MVAAVKGSPCFPPCPQLPAGAATWPGWVRRRERGLLWSLGEPRSPGLASVLRPLRAAPRGAAPFWCRAGLAREGTMRAKCSYCSLLWGPPSGYLCSTMLRRFLKWTPGLSQHCFPRGRLPECQAQQEAPSVRPSWGAGAGLPAPPFLAQASPEMTAGPAKSSTTVPGKTGNQRHRRGCADPQKP